MTNCPDCATPLTTVYYAELCGPHGADEFYQEDAYLIDVGDMYGDWDSPSNFIVPVVSVPEKRSVYRTQEGCCRYLDLDLPSDDGWCPKCQDVTG